MNTVLYVVWNADPALVELGPITLRWYGVLFALAFYVGYRLMQWFFSTEQKPKEWLDSILMYVMIGTIAGARLGHVFFYQWDYYQQNLLEIFMVWKGGLASHGAAIGIIFSLWLWSRRVSKLPVLWGLDRVVITVALSGLFIRSGNFFNHEIVGKPTGTESGVKFLRNSDDLSIHELQQVTGIRLWDQTGTVYSDSLDLAYQRLETDPALAEILQDIPNRYPAQLYEAAAYTVIFLLLMFLYKRGRAGERNGLLFGLFLVLTFSARFVIEFLKEVQVDFESDMALDLGQWLSIPLVLAGFVFIALALMKRPAKA